MNLSYLITKNKRKRISNKYRNVRSLSNIRNVRLDLCFIKKFKQPLKEVLAKADELKCIILIKQILNLRKEMVNYVTENCRLYLQTEGAKEQITPLLVDYVKK